MRPFRAWRQVVLSLAAAVWIPAAAASTSECEVAGSIAERSNGLPAGLLLAIGRVESGRWSASLGRTVPWPWAINMSGNGRHAETREDAIAIVSAAMAQGVRNIDVGCFQINLLHHPNAFNGLVEAFDPAVNAGYAARFLSELRGRLGSWSAAVEAYHSADPARAIPYGRNVMTSWGAGASALTTGAPAQPVAAYGMRIWTPSASGSAPQQIVVMPAAPATALPRVENITSNEMNRNR